MKDPFLRELSESIIKYAPDQLPGECGVYQMKSIKEQNKDWPICNPLEAESAQQESENISKKIFKNLTNATLNNPAALRTLKDMTDDNLKPKDSKCRMISVDVLN